MSPVREVSLTALREIRRNLASTKGIAMSVLFFLGGLVPAVLYLAATKLQGGITEAPEVRQQLMEEALKQKGIAADVAHHLASVPPQLAQLFKGTLIFAPFLILLIGFDQIAGDIQHRAIRYIAGRSRRESIVAGKALGLWGIVAVLVLILNVTVWIVTMIQGGSPVVSVLSWGPRVWLYTACACASWVGLIALVSSFFKTPIVALFVGAPVFFGLWLTNVILEYVNPDHAARWALPFRYEELLTSHEPLKVLGGAAASIAWGALMVALATVVVKRRDI